MAGYSGTPLVRKLGLKAGMRAIFLHAPDGYARTLGTVPPDVGVRKRLAKDMNFVQLFCADTRALERSFPRAQRALARDGMLWVCWPKRASGVDTDLSEGTVRGYGLAQGLVDIKVCAVDDTWSALKFVYRVADR